MREKQQKFGFLVLMTLVCAIAFSGFTYIGEEAMAASTTVPDIKIACVYPLSGAASRNGNLTVQGIKAAIGWVNDNGGIKSLGGAKLVPIIGDSASTVEGAANAMERICRDADIVMAMGSWASSFTMASTEVTERLGIPQFSISFADALTQRGFKWGFYVAPPSSFFGKVMPILFDIAQSAGDPIKTVMLVGDNQVAAIWYYKTIKEYLTTVGAKLIGEETWALGTLTDATPVMQKAKTLNPDIVFIAATAISECQLVLMKRKEFGVKVPFVSSSAWLVDPIMRPLGAEVLDGLISFSPCYPHKRIPEEWITRSLNQVRKEYSNEPWVSQELFIPWLMVPVMAEILERAGSRDKQKIWEAAHKLDIQNVTAALGYPKQGIAFDKNGRISEKHQGFTFIQWQGGLPSVVYPPELAQSKVIWKGRK